MKLLVLADIHGDEVVLEKLQAHRKDAYDYVLVAGDSTNNSTSFMADLIETFPNAYMIPGNNESANVLEIMHRAKHYAHEKRFELKEGYNVAGFGFSNPTPFHTPGELKDDEIYQKLSKMKIDGKTILLLHAPPYGLLDEIKGNHVGSQAIRKIIEEKQPYMVFCGHLHEVIGIERLGKTLIVNVPAAENGRFCTAELTNSTVCVQFKEI
ncbi:3',5'-cyclic adenosine monophosphate phosphodiesterase CpdA [uncultured archaeon]|nr:3',5'-cyclic adenosine monophosphate phosphodiesterase CpdA [uncultured archaeon]